MTFLSRLPYQYVPRFDSHINASTKGISISGTVFTPFSQFVLYYLFQFQGLSASLTCIFVDCLRSQVAHVSLLFPFWTYQLFDFDGFVFRLESQPGNPCRDEVQAEAHNEQSWCRTSFPSGSLHNYQHDQVVFDILSNFERI